MTPGVKPRIARARLAPKAFRPGRPRGRRPAVGSRLRFRLSEAARVNVTVQRARPRRRFRKVQAFRVAGKAGANTRAFTGRVRGRALRPGLYRLLLRAKDPAGFSSKRVALRFRIRPR